MVKSKIKIKIKLQKLYLVKLMKGKKILKNKT